MSAAVRAATDPRGLVAVDAGVVENVDRCIHAGLITGPTLDIEVIAGPCSDFPATSGDDTDALAEDAVARARMLRKPLGGRHGCSVLLALGSPVVTDRDGLTVEGVDATEVWRRALKTLKTDSATVTSIVDGSSESVSASVCRIADADDPDAIAGLVVIVAVPDGADPAQARDLVSALASGPAKNAPLYVIGLSPSPVEELSRWTAIRASIVLHGPAAPDQVLTAGLTSLGAPRDTADVTLVPCPPFRAGSGMPGLTRLRIDVAKGQVQVAINRDLGSDRMDTTVQVVRPLASASRVTHTELHLYNHVRDLVNREVIELTRREEDSGDAVAFRARVDREWEETGYVKLCTEDGRLAGMRPTRSIRYMLLVVLRQRPDDGGYDILLSNHSPLRASRLAEWNTLLLPAFQHPYTLLEHLRDDVVRQASERAEDLARAEHADGFEQAIADILGTARHSDEQIWADEIRELATRSFRKISPTTGFVTEYEYHLVTLRPLIERRDRAPGEDPMERATSKVVAWLGDLDAVCAEPPTTDSLRTIDPSALRLGGGGLRFDPQAGFAQEPGRTERARARKLPPGAVWFPVDQRGRSALWRDCPAIVARNADVMAWLDAQLDRLADDRSQLPRDLVLGQHAGGRGYEVCETFPFDDGRRYCRGDEPERRGTSTCDALSRVRFDAASDLAGERAYAGSEFRRVYLLRRDLGAAGKNRDAIVVLDAERFDENGDEAGPHHSTLGVLRPVQRYVLTAGMERAAAIEREVMPALRRRDPWGFAKVSRGNVGELVSVTPPIVERLHRDDWTDEEGREFVLCDGNHRVVDQAWNGGKLLPAVLVEHPVQPYYAHPFGTLEWGATAENEVPSTPSRESKYMPRRVDLDAIADPEQRSQLAATPAADRFRRYFRDLPSGFGSVGGQGGRWGV